MAIVKKTIFLQVKTYSPKDDKMLVVKGATVTLSDKGSLGANILTAQPLSANNNDVIPVEVEYDDFIFAEIKPAFAITIPEAERHMLTGNAADEVKLPATWETHHEAAGKSLEINKHLVDTHPFVITVGLYAHLSFGGTDHHPSGKRNPMAIRDDTLQMALTDEDWTTCRWLNPEDVLVGFGASADGTKNEIVGKQGFHPYRRLPWPVAPRYPLKDKVPFAWWEPPGLPIGHLGGGSFESTGPLTCAPDGMVLMVDGKTLHRFFPDGTLANSQDLKLAANETAVAVATNADHRVFIAVENSAGQDYIDIYRLSDNEGDFDRSFNSYSYEAQVTGWTDSGGAKTFGTIVDLVCVSDENEQDYLAVLDAGAGATSPKGLHLFSVSYQNTAPRTKLIWRDSAATGVPAAGGLTTPVAVCAVSPARLFAADSGQHRIQRFSINSQQKLAVDGFWGKADQTAGAGEGQFDKPDRLVGDSKNGIIYALDRGNGRIVRIDAANGNWLHQWKPAPLPDHMTVDTRGELYTTEAKDPGTHGGRVQRWTTYDQANGNALAMNADPVTFGKVWQDQRQTPNFIEPGYVHVDRLDNLWVSDEQTGEVSMWPLEADRTRKPEPSLTLKKTFSTPRGLTSDHNNNLFVVAAGSGEIWRFDQPWTGNGVEIGTALEAFSQPHGIAAFRSEEKDMLAVADTGNNRVVFLNLTDNASFDMKAPNSTSFSGPTDVAANQKGEVIALDAGNKRILSLPYPFELADAALEITLIQPALEPPEAKEPTGLSFDADGNILYTDAGHHRILHLNPYGALIGWWDFTHLARHTMRTSTRSGLEGRVTLSDPKEVDIAQTYENRGYTQPQKAMTLTVTDKSGGTEVHNLTPHNMIMVKHDTKVSTGDKLFSSISPRAFYRELAQMLVLRKPRRAVADKAGVLFVADTGNRRIRAMQTRTHLKMNLVALDERFPDLSLRTKTVADWSEDLNIQLSIWLDKLDDRVIRYEEAGSQKTEDYKDQSYRKDYLFNASTRFHEVAYLMHWMREILFWMHRHTSGGTVAKWPKADKTIQFKINARDSVKGTSAFTPFAHRIRLTNDITGKGRDSWDVGVISHEMGHWLSYTLPTFAQWSHISIVDGSGNHNTHLLTSQATAVIEGYASYIAMAFDDEYDSLDRIRGNGIDDLYELETKKGIKKQPFAAPNQNLECEGFFTNTLYQLHRLLMQPGVGFADHPSFWHGYNHVPPAGQTSDYAKVFVEAFARLPKPLGIVRANVAVETFFNAFRAAWHSNGPANFNQALTAIFELNNLFNPKLTWHDAGNGYAAGDEVNGKPKVSASSTHKFTLKLVDHWDQVLPHHHVVVKFSGIPAAANTLVVQRQGNHAIRGKNPDPASLGGGKVAITDNNGLAGFDFNLPAGIKAGDPDITLTATYTPDFVRDGYFSRPQRGDNWLDTERKCYLRALRLSSEKPADRNTHADGAESQRSITFTIQ